MNDLSLTDLYHVGLAVSDLDDAISRYTSLGMEKWVSYEVEFQGVYRGSEASLAVRVALANAGPIWVELVQPTKGDWTPSVFLAERGEGIYHLGYWVDDLSASMEKALELGYQIDLVSESGGFAYLGSEPTAGVHIELVSTKVRPFMEQLLAGAS